MTSWDKFVQAWDDKLLKPQVVQGDWWHVVPKEHEDEQTYVPADLFTEKQAVEYICGTSILGMEAAKEVNKVTGWGARLSAPGYLDSSEWELFETEEEARTYLMETYGDDEH